MRNPPATHRTGHREWHPRPGPATPERPGARRAVGVVRPVITLVLAALLGILLPATDAGAASGHPFTTRVTNFDADGNQVVRYDTEGNSVDAHDGEIAFFDGTYYLYGTSYDCGFAWQATSSPFCGFKVYSSPDLVHWTDRGQLFDATDSVWQTRCNGATYGCFRPHVNYDANTGTYALWVNVYDNSVGFRVFTGSSPVGPFSEAPVPTLAVNNDAPPGGTNNGDHDVFVDSDGTGYLAYTDWRGNGDLVVERLSPDHLSGTGEYTRLSQSRTEAPALFERDGTYYLTYSDPNCGYCAGTGTSYRTAPDPLGPWSQPTKISSDSCGGQPAFVSEIPTTSGTAYLYASDLWNNGQRNEALANYYWAPLEFTDTGAISPMTCRNSFSLTLATGAAGHQIPRPDADQADGVSGFRTYCDIRSGVARFQTFTPSRSGTLSAVSYSGFQTGNPDAGLEVSIYEASESFQPTGAALSSTAVPAAKTGWSPRDVTVAPDITVTAGQRYGLLISSDTTTGCYGLAYNDSSPYPGGGESYSDDNGSTFRREAGRSLKFSTCVRRAGRT
ncbi:family 43 glycosylhydrolase [Streptomyces sp. NPDC091267]|uniref:family 43 glycosylhydrolase n=1 Tax=Streptomyces sp. NPDC091267 TaxID=3155195 RepID=UPI003420B49D